MPSFDIVSEIDQQELTNAVDQANREISNRFDFKGTDSKIELIEIGLTIISSSEFQVKQIHDILETKIVKRKIDVRCLKYGDIIENNKEAQQIVEIKKGVDAELARKIVKIIKSSKLKVQAAVQGDQVRLTGKKRDDLQQTIAAIKEEKFGTPLQYINFRD
ncbi:MAG: YajQ family cyclic di-GMP-binding protein [Legionellales bacterium]|nr:YajQ family cyclic di-GMP-binding protein [Legionellales bacterium]|tara:strand:+ start:163 stop:645 length:483 start_codon:yes stop_codon:yes gene_type:complete